MHQTYRNGSPARVHDWVIGQIAGAERIGMVVGLPEGEQQELVNLIYFDSRISVPGAPPPTSDKWPCFLAKEGIFGVGQGCVTMPAIELDRILIGHNGDPETIRGVTKPWVEAALDGSDVAHARTPNPGAAATPSGGALSMGAAPEASGETVRERELVQT
jgi:hypothetical protein